MQPIERQCSYCGCFHITNDPCCSQCGGMLPARRTTPVQFERALKWLSRDSSYADAVDKVTVDQWKEGLKRAHGRFAAGVE